MFLKFLKPQIVFGSGGSDSGGGGGGGGGSSSSSKKKTTTTVTTSPKPKPKPAAKTTTTSSKIGTDAGDGMVWAKSKNSNALVRVSAKKSSGGGRNLDADMAAGSPYAPTKNAGTANAKQYTYTGETDSKDRKLVPLENGTKLNSKTSVTAKDLAAGKVTTYKSKTGTGSVTVARGASLADVPTVNVGVDGKKTVSNADAYDPVGSTPNKTSPVATPSSDPVVAPETIAPQDGVGGGRDGGASAKRNKSKVSEDNLKVSRSAEGVDRYKRKQSMAIKTAGENRRKNPLAIAKNSKRTA